MTVYGPLVYAMIGEPGAITAGRPIRGDGPTPDLRRHAERELAVERAVELALEAGIPVRVDGPLDDPVVTALTRGPDR